MASTTSAASARSARLLAGIRCCPAASAAAAVNLPFSAIFANWARIPAIARHNAASADADVGDRSAFAFELGAGVEYGRVLDGRGDDVFTGWASGSADGSEDGQIVGFSSPGNEDDLRGVAAQEFGHLAAGLVEPVLGGLAIVVDTGSVAVHFKHHWNHRFQYRLRYRRRRVVIEVETPHL